MQIKYCGDCNERLQPGNDFCQCGWGLKKHTQAAKETSVFDDRKGLCEWNYQGRECPAPGNHSKSINGGGPWLCMSHSSIAGLTDGLRIIDNYERHGVPVIKKAY